MQETSESGMRRFHIDLGRFKNKYSIAAVLFLIWLAFFDQNNLVERLQNKKELRQLKEDKVYYQEKIKENAERLKELKTNKDNLEKFAREQYLMKRDNEDVFVIVEE